MTYENKVVIITGGTKGIGEGCVKVFAAAGAKVVYCARHRPDKEDLSSSTGDATFVQCDVSNTDEIRKLAAMIVVFILHLKNHLNRLYAI